MIINDAILLRKGARKAIDIPSEVLKLLNAGVLESANLTEWLAIDHIKLVKSVFPELDLESLLVGVCEGLVSLKKASTMNSIKYIGEALYSYAESNDINVFEILMGHKSDSVRAYACYVIALNNKISLAEKIKHSKKLINDTHFGVREIIWMALRPEISENLTEAIALLTNLSLNKHENIRRFSVEVIRPRGVWCKHIDRLKTNPEIALSVLKVLKNDSSKYVQDSVSNWLNDASKTSPEFVIDLCNKWKVESNSKNTLRIVKRALRSINK